jgi:alpha-beta hydrolase superfamily lysophospholipase
MITQAESTGFLDGRLGVRLFYRLRAVPDQTGMVLLLHGFGEHSGRYGHVIDALAAAGLSTLAMDYRGHGRSEGRRAYCNRFTEYVDDAETGLVKARELAQGKSLFLVGHSFGGLIAASYLIQRGAEGIRGLVLSGPCFEFSLPVPTWKVWLGKTASRFLPTLAVPAGVDPKELSRDPAVGEKYAADPLVLRTATARWYTEALEAEGRALAGAGAVKLPSLVMHGAADHIVSPHATERFFAAMSSEDKTLRIIPGARHEIFNETDQEQTIGEVVGWLRAH